MPAVAGAVAVQHPFAVFARCREIGQLGAMDHHQVNVRRRARAKSGDVGKGPVVDRGRGHARSVAWDWGLGLGLGLGTGDWGLGAGGWGLGAGGWGLGTGHEAVAMLVRLPTPESRLPT